MPVRGPYTSVLPGEPAASKTASRGSTPRARAVLIVLVPTWLETERHLSCKQDDAGAKPAVGPVLLCEDDTQISMV
jgi:hypothetical protein